MAGVISLDINLYLVMKKIVLLFVAVCLMLSLSAQTNFQNLVLDKALDKAKGEGKMVFVDCYTSWCGPCKMMAEEILPLKEVGEYMNEKFVCVKYDMEVGEGKDIAGKFHVTAYPTFLVLDGNGKLLHRVIGGTATGEEFLQKLKNGLDENSITSLETRYRNGERGVEFMVRYVQALKNYGNLEQAKTMMFDLLTSIGDRERCSVECWPIYDDPELSPVGSGNMMYFLRFANLFRQKVGNEIVDTKIGSVFENQLEDILRGRNRNVTLATVEGTEQMLKAYRLQGKDYLFDYVELIKAMLAGNSEMALLVCQKVFSSMSDEKLSYLYFQPILALKGKWNKQQKKELIGLTQELMTKTKSEVLKGSLKSFADSMIPNL